MTYVLDDLDDLDSVLNGNNFDITGPEKEASLNKKQRAIIALEARRRVELKLEEAYIRKEIGGYDVDYYLD